MDTFFASVQSPVCHRYKLAHTQIRHQWTERSLCAIQRAWAFGIFICAMTLNTMWHREIICVAYKDLSIPFESKWFCTKLYKIFTRILSILSKGMSIFIAFWSHSTFLTICLSSFKFRYDDKIMLHIITSIPIVLSHFVLPFRKQWESILITTKRIYASIS